MKKKEIKNSVEVDLENTPKYFLSDDEAYAYCEETTQLARGVKVAYMMLAERLYRIKKQKLYQPTYEKWYQYLDEIDINQDVASKMITIYKTFIQAFDYKMEELKDIGYTKLYLIRDVSETKELAEHWIGEARVLSRDDLKKKVTEYTTGVDQMTCEHLDTYLVRCCRSCGEKWEEYPKTN